MNEERDWPGAAWLVSALVGAVQLKQLWSFWHLPEETLALSFPDDAFYYLVPAKHFAVLGRWTFDGVEPASGFHMLWAYLLAAFYWVFPNAGLHAVVITAAAFCMVCITTAVWLCCRCARSTFGPGAEAGVAIIFLSPLALRQGTLLMEGPLSLLFAAAIFYWVWRGSARLTPGTLAIAAALGFGGMLARSDFGLLPACVVAAEFAARWRNPQQWGRLKIALAELAGALVGMATVLLHTHSISGNWLQSSAVQKLRIARMTGFSFRAVWIIVQGLLQFSYPTWPRVAAWKNSADGKLLLNAVQDCWLLALAGVAAWILVRGGWRSRAVVAAALSTTIGYLELYRMAARTWMVWYGAQFMVPLALLAAAVCAYAARRLRWGVVAAVLLAFVGAVLPYPAPNVSAWEPEISGGKYLRQHPELAPVGAWSAGALGYFAGGNVVNLDGLINDAVVPYSLNGSLAQYVGKRGIRSIFDNNVMFRRQMSIHGGYGDGKLRSCLVPEDILPDDAANGQVVGERFLLYHVKPDCPGLK